MTIGTLMLDIAGTTLAPEDKDILSQPQVGGVILFSRNIVAPEQVRTLTDSIRAVRSDILIGVDQEGGRVRRLREGFSPIPAMGELGQFFEHAPVQALKLSFDCGVLMASEVLAVGIDFSFAPVLDINGASQVIGDRSFHADIDAVNVLSAAFMRGMRSAGMATTGKHFPGHGTCAPDSHIADAVDTRPLADIEALDLQPFIRNLHLLDALMPAHVIYPKVDSKPAGFSRTWLQEILRQKYGFAGVLFSDDLSMKAAHTAGDAGARVEAAVQAGCDMALVCNDRSSAELALTALEAMPLPNQERLERMRGRLPKWQGSLDSTCANQGAAQRITQQLEQNAADALLATSHTSSASSQNTDPTNYM